MAIARAKKQKTKHTGHPPTTTMTPTDNIGEYFKDRQGIMWQLIAYCDSPSVQYKRVGTNNTLTVGVGSLIDSNMKKMKSDD